MQLLMCNPAHKPAEPEPNNSFKEIKSTFSNSGQAKWEKIIYRPIN